MLAIQLLSDVQSVLEAKAKDYGANNDPLFNFHLEATMIDIAVQQGLRGRDISYLTLIMVKIGRLITLIGKGAEPTNESLQDTFSDLLGYAALWGQERTE